MRLAIPARVEELTTPGNAIVNLGGVRKEISLALVDDVQAGEYVIVHVGYALQKLDQEEAEHTLALFAEMGAMDESRAAWMTVLHEYIDEFRDGELAKNIAARHCTRSIFSNAPSPMEFCGGHTHAISRYGLADLLPASVRMIHGPGCPVCVLPVGRVDQVIAPSAPTARSCALMPTPCAYRLPTIFR